MNGQLFHITNGDVVAGLIAETGLPGEILPWRDVLHEGPVPMTGSLQQLAPIRVAFLSSTGWAPAEAIESSFAARAAFLAAIGSGTEVVLWFEHDLYDQLQLLQVLWYFSTERPDISRISLVSIGSFPGLDRFTGLGELSASDLAALFDSRKPVPISARDNALAAYQAFTSPDPQHLLIPSVQVSADFPFLRTAIRRLLSEYPDPRNGLSQTAEQSLRELQRGRASLRDLYKWNQILEPAPYLGDTVYFWLMEQLIWAEHPAITVTAAAGHPGESAVELSAIGRQLIERRANWIDLNGIDRWIGGVHLSRDSKIWTFHRDAGELAAM